MTRKITETRRCDRCRHWMRVSSAHSTDDEFSAWGWDDDGRDLCPRCVFEVGTP